MSLRTDSLLIQILKNQCENNNSTPSNNPSSIKDVELTCISNDGGITNVTGVIIYDTSLVPPSETIYLNGIDVTGAYVKVSCDNPIKYDYEIKDICVDGVTFTKVYVFDKTGDGSPNLVSIFWLDNLDTVVPAPNPLLVNNSNCITSVAEIGLEEYSNLSNITQNSSFNANQISISYYPPLGNSTPILVKILGTNIIGSGQFEVFPNNQETRKFILPNITGVQISGSIGPFVTVEFQLN